MYPMILLASFEFAFPVKAGVSFLHTPEHWMLAFRDLDLRIDGISKPAVIRGYSTVQFGFHSILGSGNATMFTDNKTCVRIATDNAIICMKVKPTSLGEHHMLTIDYRAAKIQTCLTCVKTSMILQRHTIKHALRRKRDNVLLENENFRLYRQQVIG